MTSTLTLPINIGQLSVARDIRRKDEPILIRAIEAMKTIKVKKTHLIQCNADRDTIVPDSFRNFRSSVLFLMVVKHCYPA